MEVTVTALIAAAVDSIDVGLGLGLGTGLGLGPQPTAAARRHLVARLAAAAEEEDALGRAVFPATHRRRHLPVTASIERVSVGQCGERRWFREKVVEMT